MHDKVKFFDEVARSADPLMFMEGDYEKVQALKRRLGDLSGQRVLEPGCGAGPLTALLADWVGRSGRVEAFDASPAMVELCRESVAGRANVSVFQAAVEEMENELNQFDLILCFRVFPHFDDKTFVLRCCKQWLKRGGRLVIANLEGSQRLNALHASFSHPVQHDRMPSASELGILLDEAGFRTLVSIDVDDEFYVEAVLAEWP